MQCQNVPSKFLNCVQQQFDIKGEKSALEYNNQMPQSKFRITSIVASLTVSLQATEC